MVVETGSEAETEGFGRQLGVALRRPLTLLLKGPLGAGKSVVARGIARGLGVAPGVPITSPTFTLMNHYPARLDLYHFDLYRLADAEELIEIGFDDFAHGRGIALVEWPERLESFDFDHLLLEIERLSASRRRLRLSAKGGDAGKILAQLETAMAVK